MADGFGDEAIDTLMIDVRAGTQGFAADIAQMRGTFDATLVDGFARAGDVLERGLLGAIRRGSLGFEDLKRVALRVLDDIASQALRGGLGQFGDLLRGVGGPGGGGSIVSIGAGLFGAALGLPGRATGGNVAPHAAYLVGERGPEIFVPTSAGRVEAGGRSEPREIRVSIQLNTPAGMAHAESLRRSSRQVASAVRRALASD